MPFSSNEVLIHYSPTSSAYILCCNCNGSEIDNIIYLHFTHGTTSLQNKQKLERTMMLETDYRPTQRNKN